MLFAQTIEKELCPVWIRKITKQKIYSLITRLHAGILQESEETTDFTSVVHLL